MGSSLHGNVSFKNNTQEVHFGTCIRNFLTCIQYDYKQLIKNNIN